jgi:hypothetical protein
MEPIKVEPIKVEPIKVEPIKVTAWLTTETMPDRAIIGKPISSSRVNGVPFPAEIREDGKVYPDLNAIEQMAEEWRAYFVKLLGLDRPLIEFVARAEIIARAARSVASAPTAENPIAAPSAQDVSVQAAEPSD